MRQFRTFAFLFSLLFAHYVHATPIHVDVKGIVYTTYSTGPSPIPHGSKVIGWYELDWDKAKVGGEDLFHNTIYTGILTYQFTIAGLTLRGLDPNIEYHSPTSEIFPNSDNLQFQDLYPELFVQTFPIIEELDFSIRTLNSLRKARFSYDSVSYKENEKYSGYCDLEEINVASVVEPASFIIFIFGFASILLMRMKRK